MYEQGLVAAAKRGQSVAFEALCRPYAKKLEQTTFRITRNREDSEDAVQDALLNAFVHLKDFDGRSSFATWLTRIAINSALMILRKKRGSLEVAIEGSDDSGKDRLHYQIPDHTPNPERRYAQREEETILNRAVERLRPALREAVRIQRLQECSMQ